MKLKNISNIGFGFTATAFTAVGMGLLSSEKYLLGAAFLILSLTVLVVREILKKHDIDVDN
jgi:hypothetical protein